MANKCKSPLAQNGMRMDTYTGHIEYKLTGKESKSEGFAANLITSDGMSYRLYRKGAFEINDNFFKQFDQQEVEVNGELEDTGFICVASVKSSEGELLQALEFPSLPTDLVFQPKEKAAKNKQVLVLKKKKKSNNNIQRRKK